MRLCRQLLDRESDVHLLSVIIKSILFFILKKSPSFNDKLYGHTMDNRQDLKQDSSKGVMAVCDSVGNPESSSVCINQKTKLKP